MTEQNVDRALVRQLAELARLHLPAEREQAACTQLEKVLAAFRALAAVDTAGVEPTSYPLPLPMRLRADAPGAVLAPEEVLANAPRQAAGAFVVPRVVEG
jgi:aspartyl-tRNA(Asn)/glutamyl-tRNA(Gln) amidotransferase subunit C